MAAAACSQTAALLGSRASGLSSGSGGAVAPPAPRRHRCKAAARAAAGGSSSSHASPQQKDAASLDVSGAVVSPSFRSTPWAAEAAAAGDGARPPASVLLVSESGICRAPLAAAALAVALQRRGLGDRVQLGCRASRDFCLGEGPDPAAASAAADLGLALPQGYAVQQFKEAEDIVTADVVLVVDKFVAADVLREVRASWTPGRAGPAAGLEAQSRCCAQSLHAWPRGPRAAVVWNSGLASDEIIGLDCVQVSVFDTIKTWGQANYSSKARRNPHKCAL